VDQYIKLSGGKLFSVMRARGGLVTIVRKSLIWQYVFKD
jgi:hypothetical protein